jgi:hypothetical protein
LQQIDPTKLRWVALLGAAAGYVDASMDAKRASLSYASSPCTVGLIIRFLFIGSRF